ncbi:MAG: lipopolysaccharide biosynthesis protein [Pseudomonadota bacterium]
MSLKEKTLNGLIWSVIDSFANQGVQFVAGIVLARLLSPREFGLIGMITIFIAISQSFIDSGFSQALIRKNDCVQADYSTVFYFNLLIAILCYLALFVSAGPISRFFKEPQIQFILQVLGSALIINALTIVQRTQLVKRIDFKLQARISVIASVGSGAIGIGMAFHEYGVWSLVVQSLSMAAFNSFFLWLWNGWRPAWLFDWDRFKVMFAFGSRLLISGLIDTSYRNIYLLVIGKYFSAVELGYYTRACQFNDFPSQKITGVIQRVSYPVLVTIQNNPTQLKSSYKILIRSTMLISCVLMMGMAAVAEPMVLTLIGEKWRPSIIYLQLLCFVGMFYPLHALNLNMLKVQGRSDLFLRLEIIKKILAVPIIIIGISLGIKAMIVGMMVNTLIAYYLNSYWSGRFIGYKMAEQIRDILPSFMLACFTGSAAYLIGLFSAWTPAITLIVQVAAGALITVGMAELLKMANYLYIKQMILSRFKGGKG